MSEEKKDLTGILEYAQKLQNSNEAPPIPEGSFSEEIPIEKIEEFESLDEYALSNPVPTEIPPNTPIDAPADSQEFPIAGTESSSSNSGNSDDSAFSVNAPESAVENNGNSFDFNNTDTPSSNEFNSSGIVSEDFPQNPPLQGNEFLPESSTDFETSPDSMTSPQSISNDFQIPEFPAELQPLSAPAPESEPPQATQPELPTPALSPPPAQETQKKSAPEKKAPAFLTPLPPEPPFSTLLAPPVLSAVPAALPFSILIDGPLTPEEKEKLLDLIEREKMGIRSIDLEIQFQSGKILIPRISEFAAIVIVQAMRGIKARLKFGPSDLIFSTESTRENYLHSSNPSQSEEKTYIPQNTPTTHPAESIPISTFKDQIPQLPHFVVIDVISASATLETEVIEAKNSKEYQDLLESLQKEIKYKAHRRGATAILNYQQLLNTLSSPSRYKITVMGTAVKAAHPPELAQDPSQELRHEPTSETPVIEAEDLSPPDNLLQEEHTQIPTHTSGLIPDQLNTADQVITNEIPSFDLEMDEPTHPTELNTADEDLSVTQEPPVEISSSIPDFLIQLPETSDPVPSS